MTEGGEVVLKTGSAEPVLAHAPTDIASELYDQNFMTYFLHGDSTVFSCYRY